MTERNRKRHKFRRFINGIAKHQALISGTNLIQRIDLAVFGFKWSINAHCNIGRLFVNCSQNGTIIAIETKFSANVADTLDRVTNYFLNINVGTCWNFSNNNYQSGCYSCFSCDPGIRILFKQRIQNCITDLIGNFIRVSFWNWFWRKQMSFWHNKIPPFIIFVVTRHLH